VRGVWWASATVLIGCIQLEPVADPDAPDPTELGTTLLVSVGGGPPPEVVVFAGFEPLDRLVVRADRSLFRLAYRAAPAGLGLEPGPVSLPESDDPRQQPLPPPDFSYRLSPQGWTLEDGLPEVLSALRLPGTDLEGCAAQGGCFLDPQARDARRCSLDCPSRLQFEPTPPVLPVLSSPACPPPRTSVTEDFELQPVGGQLRHARCIGPETPDCGTGARATVDGTCVPRLDCGEAAWVTRVGEVDFWVPDRPAASDSGAIRPNLQAAAAEAEEGDVIAFSGAQPLSGMLPGVELRGRCPDQASLELSDASTHGPLRMDHLTLRPAGSFQGSFALRDGELVAAQPAQGGQWSVIRSRFTGTGSVDFDGLAVEQSQLALARLGPGRLGPVVDALIDVDDLDVGGDFELEGSELAAGQLRVQGRWTAFDSLVRGPFPGNAFQVGAVAWTDLTLDLEGDQGSLMELEEGGRMERVTATRTDGSASLLQIQPGAELEVFDASFRNVELLALGRLELTDVATFGAGRRAALRAEGGEVVARKLAVVQPAVALLARRGADLDLEDVLISESGCEPVAVGPDVFRSAVDGEARASRGCVRAAFEGTNIPADDANTVRIRRMAVQDESVVSFLKSQVQVVGGGRFDAADLRLARAPGRGLVFQGDMDVELGRVLVQDAVILGACFFPGLRFEAFPPDAPVRGQPRVRLEDVRVEDMDVGLMLLEDERDTAPLDIGFDGLAVLRADIGVVRATVQSKTNALGLDLDKWLLRGAFVDVPVLTEATPNDACD